MPQNSSHLSSQKILRRIAAWESSYLAFSITVPSRLRSIATGIFSTRPRPLFYDFSIALALLLAAILLRLLDDPMVSGRLPFTTFYPALAAVAVLCNLRITIVFVIASAALGSLLWDPPILLSAYSHEVGSIVFMLAAAVIVVLAEGIKDAYSQIVAAEERLRTLNGELVHRIRNIFQMSSAIVSQSVRTASNTQEMEKAVLGRLYALSAAQTVAVTGTGDAPLAGLIELVLTPLRPSPDRLSLSGPHFTLPPPVMTMLALVLHELGTNAVKYGAWSDLKGIVEVRWRCAAGTVTIDWIERDGPPVETPKRLGAGSKLIRNAIPEAAVDYRLEGDGARCRIEFPLAGLADKRP